MVARIRTTTADGVRYSYVPNRGESARARELAESREALAGEGANAGIAPAAAGIAPAARVPSQAEVSAMGRQILPN
jgi:hypothetical protein